MTRHETESAIAGGQSPTVIRVAAERAEAGHPRAGRYTYEEVFANFAAIGIDDFVLDRPEDAELDTFESAARRVLN